MTKGGFLIKIIPPEGYSVYRLRFTRRHLVALGIAVAIFLLGGLGIHTYQLHAASANIAALEEQKNAQQRELEAIDAQAQSLQLHYVQLQKQTDAIMRLLGVDRGPKAGRSPHALVASKHRYAVADVRARLRELAAESARTTAEAQRLQMLAVRVLNLRRMASITRERLIASIPSVMPVDGFISATFGYRSSPWPEFHKGLDLAADYGASVRATAAGTVVEARWVAGYGIRVDINHGNGYHTWYCHLSRANVTLGERVVKGQPIALVGSTGESTGPHLHYQVMKNGVAIDPQPYLSGVPPAVLATLPDPAHV
ncbi:MAG: peptidoglycan DD-metalloendopeptidase family protein [Candidatus Velthaea sp.]